MMQRRGFLSALLGATALGMTPSFNTQASASDTPFSLSTLVNRAKAMSREKYVPRPEVPKEWRDLTYDQYKSIWFNTNKGIWRNEGSAFELDFFHPGLYFPRPVRIHLIEDGIARELAFDFSLFDKTDKVPDLPMTDTLGYSGFRLRTELEKAGVYQEFLVVQGASYFRAIGKNQIYGLSARGLAINTASPEGEEFPDFTEFWIEKSPKGQTTITFHALLDSPSATGVYSFEVSPGVATTMDVSAQIFARTDLTNIGLGALTSMFLFDQSNRDRFDDFRPAVHDSDGLMIQNGAGETLWRSLANPKALQISSFVDENPKGFGLMQRPDTFSDFTDLEALYHKRPGLWIEPKDDWGKGSVTLVEIPADREIYDNIVAYWRPHEPVSAGTSHTFSYRMTWGKEPAGPLPVARVLNTQMGKRFSGGRLAVIDFAPHPALPDNLSELARHVSSNTGTVSDGVLQRNPETGGARLAFTFDPEGANSVELRAQLLHQKRAVSEVWLYRWTE